MALMAGLAQCAFGQFTPDQNHQAPFIILTEFTNAPPATSGSWIGTNAGVGFAIIGNMDGSLLGTNTTGIDVSSLTNANRHIGFYLDGNPVDYPHDPPPWHLELIIFDDAGKTLKYYVRPWGGRFESGGTLELTLESDGFNYASVKGYQLSGQKPFGVFDSPFKAVFRRIYYRRPPLN